MERQRGGRPIEHDQISTESWARTVRGLVPGLQVRGFAFNTVCEPGVRGTIPVSRLAAAGRSRLVNAQIP